MSTFRTLKDVVNYPPVTFHSRPYRVSFALDYNVTPLIPHASMTFYPRWDASNPNMGAEQHWHVPFYLHDAKRLHKWLGEYLVRRGVAVR